MSCEIILNGEWLKLEMKDTRARKAYVQVSEIETVCECGVLEGDHETRIQTKSGYWCVVEDCVEAVFATIERARETAAS